MSGSPIEEEEEEDEDDPVIGVVIHNSIQEQTFSWRI